MIKGSRRIFSWDCFVCSLSLYSRNNTIICFLFHKKFLSLFDNIFLSLTTFSLKYFPSDVCLLKSEWLLSIVTKVFCSVYECTLVQSSEDLYRLGLVSTQHRFCQKSRRIRPEDPLVVSWVCPTQDVFFNTSFVCQTTNNKLFVLVSCYWTSSYCSNMAKHLGNNNGKQVVLQ